MMIGDWIGVLILSHIPTVVLCGIGVGVGEL